MRAFSAGWLAFSLVACSAVNGSVPNAGPVSPAAVPHGTGHLVLRVHIPHRKHHRRGLLPRFISPSTKGMTLAFTGPTKLTETIGLTPGSPGCGPAQGGGTTCTIAVGLAACPTQANCYSGAISTWDNVSCGSSSCRIPNGAKELSANQNVAFAIALAKKTNVGVTLDGIPVSVTLVPGAGSTLTGSGSAFSVSKCVTTAQAVSLADADADGNLIVGPGAPTTPTLSSDDTTHLAVATPAPNASPNAFTLVPPTSLASATIPNAHAVVHLTGGVTPLAGTGSTTPVGSQIDVTFNGDVCGVVSEFPIPTANAYPERLAVGSDNAIWFTEKQSNKIGRIPTNATPGSSAQVTEFAIPAGNNAPFDIAAGSDGALWFTQASGNIGRIPVSATSGANIDEYPLGAGVSSPDFIAGGSDQALWFTAGSKIGRIPTNATPGSSAQVSTYPVVSSVSAGITSGPDGALWFVTTTSTADNVERIPTNATPGSSAQISTYPIPGAKGPYDIGAQSITTGPDGALWFAYMGPAIVGRIPTDATPGSGAQITTFTAPAPGNPPEFPTVTNGPDGALWLTEYDNGGIERVTTAGTFSRIPIPSGMYSSPQGIVTGPDGALWFAEGTTNLIGRLQ